MKIVISDVHEDLKEEDSLNREHYIGLIVDTNSPIEVSAHERGSVYVLALGSMAAGVYVTCLDDEGYPL